MKDRLEQFIHDNRDQFDPYEPDEKVWAGMEPRIRQKKTFRIGWKGLIWRAAAVLIIFGASFVLQEYLHQRRAVISEREGTNLMREIPELQEAEIYYTNLLDEKIRQIEPLISEHPELEETLQQDEVVEAMIQNYILKIEILEDLLDYLDENSKQHEDENAAFEI